MTLRAAGRLLATLLGLAVAGPGVAMAGPGVAMAAGPQRVCRVGDDRLTEISGLAAGASGYVVVNDGSDEASHRRIFFLDRRCSVVRTVSYSSRPRDTEDLALAADGTVWVADIGDNRQNRSTVALWRLAPGSKSPRLYRLTYPDGPHDAETLLLPGTGDPIVVTKSAGSAGVYVPNGPLDAERPTPLRRAGTVTVPLTDTRNPFSLPGQLVITGGAVSPDGRRAVLRTYADAFEFDVSGGDVLQAITGGTPRVTPLPDEPQGESIAYSPDGSALLTISEVAGQPAGSKAALLRYPVADRPSTAPPPSAPPPSAPPARSSPAATSLPPATAAARHDRVPGGALVTGAALVLAAGVLGARLARRRHKRRHLSG